MSVIPFTKLKSELQSKIASTIALFGTDAFLKKSSVDLVKKTASLSMPDLNFCKIEEFDVERVLRECMTMPFVDALRVVLACGAESASSKDVDKLVQYAACPNPSTVLILDFAGDVPKKLDVFAVDCNVLDRTTMQNWIRVQSKKLGVLIDENAVVALIDRTNGNMSRVKSELEKLASFALDDGKISAEMVNENVAAENEYQVFEFADLVAKRNKSKALEMMNTMLVYEKNIFGVWSVLYNHFRRMFYAKITKRTTKEIADMFGVKEFAIKKAKEQAENFRASELKEILDIIGETEANIKLGNMNQDLAIKTSLVNILNTRG